MWTAVGPQVVGDPRDAGALGPPRGCARPYSRTGLVPVGRATLDCSYHIGFCVAVCERLGCKAGDEGDGTVCMIGRQRRRGARGCWRVIIGRHAQAASKPRTHRNSAAPRRLSPNHPSHLAEDARENGRGSEARRIASQPFDPKRLENGSFPSFHVPVDAQIAVPCG